MSTLEQMYTFILFSHHNRQYGHTIHLLFLTTCFGSLSHHQVSDILHSPVFV
jgi:hypothetical protein